jgi:energy-coupling factor transporter transmembrane protein EcfT
LTLALATLAAAWAALRVEGRSPRAEIPLWALAAVVFLAHAFLSSRPPAVAVREASVIALRMLALLYLLRWAARAFLPRAARWLLALPVPRRPAFLSLPIESARHSLALTPLALREARLQHEALRARGVGSGAGLTGRARGLAAWLLPFLGTMLRLASSYEWAIQARGYRPGTARRAARPAAGFWPESGIVLAGAAAAAWLIVGR